MDGSVSFMSHPRYLLWHSSPSVEEEIIVAHTVAQIPDFLEGRVLHLESSAVDVPKIPSAGEGWLHARQKTAT